MVIRINGEERRIRENATLETLLELLKISTQGIAVELNKEVVPKRLLAETVLKENDVVEIIRMTGGG